MQVHKKKICEKQNFESIYGKLLQGRQQSIKGNALQGH